LNIKIVMWSFCSVTSFGCRWRKFCGIDLWVPGWILLWCYL